MTSQAERRRRKKRITLPGGIVIAQRITQGRRTDLQDGPPPIHAARARRCPLDSASALHESDMGRCILALSAGDERAALADTWAALSAARRNYRMRIIGQTGDPQCAASPMIHDRMETDQSLRVDLRTADERDAAAASAWGEWQAAIKTLPAPPMIWAIRGALDGFLGEGRLWADGKPTALGATAVAALKVLTVNRH